MWDTDSGLRNCLARLAGQAADEQLANSNKRAFAALLRTGVADLADPLPVGEVILAADVEFRLVFGNLDFSASSLDLTGITSQFSAFYGGLDEDAVAGFIIRAADSSFTAIDLPTTNPFTGNPITLKLCFRQVGEARGRLCCNPTGCTTALGSPDYTLDQDHDSSGLNSRPTGNVTVADPSCTETVTNQLAGISAGASVPCPEDVPRLGACNAERIGQTNPKAHHPLCEEGVNVGEACTPAGGVDEAGCPGVCSDSGTCDPSSTACTNNDDCKTGNCTVITEVTCATNADCAASAAGFCDVNNPCGGQEPCFDDGDCSVACEDDSFACEGVFAASPAITSPPCNSAVVLATAGGTFDDGARSPAEEACSNTPPAIGGRLRPSKPLAAFIDEDRAGTWVLTVSDNATGDVGEVVGWCLEIGN